MTRARHFSARLVMHPVRSTLFVLGVLVAATALAAVFAAGMAGDDRRRHVEQEAAETAQLLERRISAYEDALVALRGLFEIDPDPSRSRFSRFTRSLQLETRSPGFRVVSYARTVDAAGLGDTRARLLRAAGREGDNYPPFTIHPAGTRQRHLVVEYVEPVAGNERVLGFDLLSDPVRAAAAIDTQSTGRPVATAPLRLLQDRTNGRTAFVLMLAVRNRGGSLASARTGRLQGVVTAAFDVGVLVDAVLGDRSRDFDLEIYDVGAIGRPGSAAPSRANLMFDADGGAVLASGQGPGEDGVARNLEIGGRKWVVYYAPVEGVAALPGQNLPWIVAGCGLLISFLASWLFLTLAQGRSRAQEIAERMTRHLAHSERQTRQILETAHDAFVSIDQNGRITDWNHQAEATFGWARDEVLGREIAETIIPPPSRGAHREGLQRFLDSGVSKASGRLLEVNALHRGGWEIPVELTITPLRSETGYVFNAFVRDVSERRAAADLSDRQRRQLLEAQSIAELGSWEWDIASDKIEWSDELCRIFGVRPGEHPTDFEGYIELVAPGDREMTRSTVEAAYQSGEAFTFNHAVLHSNGSERIVHSRGEVVLGADGQPVRMLGTAQDITERERIEGELRRNARYFELGRDLICTVTPSGEFTQINSAWTRTLGWTEDELLGRPFTEFVHPDDREDSTAGKDRVIDSGRGHEFINRYMTKSGEWRWLEWTSMTEPDDGLMYAAARDITERKNAEERVRRNQSLLADLLDSAPDAVIIADETGCITLVNEQTEALFGYGRSELVGEPIEVLLPERVRDRHIGHRDGYLASPGTRPMGVGLELAGRRKDGSEFPVDISLSAVDSADGRLVTAFVRDITERKRVEEQVSRNQALFADLLDSAPDAVVIANDEGRITLVNTQTENMFGYERDELIGEPIESLMPERVRHRHVGHRAGYVAAPGTRPMGVGLDLAGLRKDGSEFPIDISLSAIDSDDGRLVTAFVRDITERKYAEEQVRRNQELLADLLDSAPDAVIIANERGRIALVNEQTERLFGYEREELLGEPIEVLMPGRVRERHVGHRDGYVAAPGTRPMGVGLDLFGRRKDGSEFPVDISLSAVDSDDGRLATAFVRDITERKKTETELAVAHERALEASRLKSEFVANMSHEIRTPLNGVIGMAGLLLDTDLSQEQREYVEAVSLSGDALMSVISDILDFSKIEAGKLELDRHVFDLRELVEGVTSILGTAAHDKHLELMGWVDPDLPESVYGDSARIRQVLTNLVTNAVKFTTEGEVVIRVVLEPGSAATLRFEVSDTGIGIHPTALESIFDSFSQADSSTTRQFGGTGLGLAISKQLVDLMDGTIGVESEIGTGSTFWFTVPLMVRRDRVSGPAKLDFTGTRALVVDDNPTNRTILEHQLGSWGIRCDPAAGAPEAIDLMHATADSGEPYELAIIDFNMPGTNGLELAQQIRSIPKLSSTRILMLTSSGAERALAEDAGVDALITKPVRQTRLAQEIAGLLAGAHEPESTNGAGPPAAPSAPSVSPSEVVDGPRVLVVEDNPVNQLVATRMLERRGCRVEVAGNGQEAVDLVGANEYALVFMDCQMPVLDGYEATAFIRRSEKGGRRLPIVAMTANTLKGDRERCLAAGMDDYLGKPLGPAELDVALSRLLPGRDGAQPSGDPEMPEVSNVDPLAVLVDPTRLDDAFGSDHQARADLVAHFLTNSRATIDDLASAIETRDATSAARLAHGLKGSSAVVGAERMSKIAARLCDVLTQGEIAEESTALQWELERTFELTDKAFNRETNEAIS